jgi:hypothetical protein
MFDIFLGSDIMPFVLLHVIDYVDSDRKMD